MCVYWAGRGQVVGPGVALKGSGVAQIARLGWPADDAAERQVRRWAVWGAHTWTIAWADGAPCGRLFEPVAMC